MVEAVGIALFNEQKEIFLAKRPQGKVLANKWEFPGGKKEQGESIQECILREMQEELCIQVHLKEYLGKEEFHYDYGHIALHLFMGVQDKNTPIILVEHQDAKWLHVDEITNLDIAQLAFPFIPKIKKFLKSC